MLTMERAIAPKIKKEKPLPKEKEPSEDLVVMRGMLQRLKNKDLALENPEEYRRVSRQTYKDLCTFFTEKGGDFVTDVNQIYREYAKSNNSLIVRREDPEKVVALSEGFDINIQFDPKVTAGIGDKYANCAIWPYGPNPVSGIRNAFLEGKSMAGPIVTLMAIKDNPKKVEIAKPENAMMSVGDIEREAVRIVSGTISQEDLQFIVVRIQKAFFPEESLTDREKDPDVRQVFRGFTF